MRIELLGSEVKALREGKTQIGDAYATIERGEVWLRNAHIPPYDPASTENHDPERPRKLLLHRYEIERLIGRSQRKGLTLIPTRIYFKGPRAKVELALATGKQQHDRRREIRDRDLQREVERELRDRNRYARDRSGPRTCPGDPRGRTPRAASTRPRCGSGTGPAVPEAGERDLTNNGDHQQRGSPRPPPDRRSSRRR